MRKKIFYKLISLSLVIILSLSVSTTAMASESTLQSKSPTQYQITVGSTTVSLKEGEKAVFGMDLVDTPSNHNKISLNSSRQVVTGTGGTLTVWGLGAYFYWSMVLKVPATSFLGTVTLVDSTSGLSCGNPVVTGFSGRCATRGLVGHTYIGSIQGLAYYGAKAVAKTNNNLITWSP